MFDIIALYGAAAICGMFGLVSLEAAAPTDQRYSRPSIRFLIDSSLCLLALLGCFVRSLYDYAPLSWALAMLLSAIGAILLVMSVRATKEAFASRGVTAKHPLGDTSAWFAAAMLSGCGTVMLAAAFASVRSQLFL